MANDIPADNSTLLSNKAYDQLKFVAQILLPAIGALYFGLAQIWGLPKSAEVVGTITVVDTFLGVLLGISTKSYNYDQNGQVVGYLDVHHLPDGKQMQLNFPGDPNDIENHQKVTFKVRNKQP